VGTKQILFNMKILITGANRFIGQALCDELLRQSYSVRAAVRSSNSLLIGNIESVIVGSIDGDTYWTDALCGVDVVIHLAARVHLMDDHPILFLNRNSEFILCRRSAAAVKPKPSFLEIFSFPYKPPDIVDKTFARLLTLCNSKTFIRFHSSLRGTRIFSDSGGFFTRILDHQLIWRCSFFTYFYA